MFRFSRHAAQRIEEMLIDPQQVKETLLNPEHKTRSKKYGTWNYRRGNLTLGVADDVDPPLVTTAVWTDRDGWVDDFNRAPYEDRYIPKSPK